jgi:uncharacterized membrane protein
LGGAAHRQGNLTLDATMQTKMNALVISSCTIIFYVRVLPLLMLTLAESRDGQRSQ